MTRQVRNVEQIRNLLRQMDRSVDDAKSRREGTVRPAAPAASTSAPSAPTSAPSPAPLPPLAQRPIQRPPSNLGNGQGHSTPGNGPVAPSNGGSTPAPSSHGNGSPPRLKAKPKRSSSDPLQDFQQRQAS
jgi:hypothetical protein